MAPKGYHRTWLAEGVLNQTSRLLEREQARIADQQEATDSSAPEDEDQSEPDEWEESYPPADDLGARYKCDVTVHLDGQADKKRLLILINNQDVYVTPQSFETALKLAIKAKSSDLGWTKGREIEPNSYHQVIRRLRKDLELSGVDASDLVECNSCKCYRFSVPPDHITLNYARIRAHSPEYGGILDAAAE